eukprot:gene7684-9147_t
MESYKSFVRKNATLLSAAEAVGQGLTWLLPNRSDELALEAGREGRVTLVHLALAKFREEHKLPTEALALAALRPAPVKPESDRCLALGELLHVVRPVVYVLALRRWGRTAWTPWIISLAIDSASISLYRRCGKELTKEQKEEMWRRQVLMAYYSLRSPCFELCTRPPLAAVGRVLQPVPLVGTVYHHLQEILFGIQAFYFYTSAS